MISLRRTFVVPLAGILLVVGLGACREALTEAGSVEAGKSEMTVRFTQLDQLGVPVQELGSFSVALSEGVPMGSAARIEEVPLSRPVQLALRKRGGSDARNLFVYVVLHESERDVVYYFRADRPDAFSATPLFSPWLPGNGEAGSTGTVYAFFVEDVGALPDAQVEVLIQTVDEERSITLLPSQHTLPARFALQVDKADLAALRSVGTLGAVSIDFSTEGGQRRIKPLPLYAVRTEDGWLGGVGDGVSRASLNYLEPLVRFEFWLLLLDL